jgi:hypothetical protein
MMILYVTLLISILITVFVVPIHGYTGAIILGIDTIGFDIFWQWLRFKILARKPKSPADGHGQLLPGIIGGFVLRVISMIVFLKLGSWWLSQNEFLCYAIFLLTLPFWSKLIAYKFKSVN